MSPATIHEPTDCWLCHRMAGPAAIGDPRNPKFLCGECLVMAEDIKRAGTMNVYERQALSDAGDKGGEYLDGIGKTDLAALEEAEYKSFVSIIVTGFGSSIRQQIRSKRAPF